MVTLENWDATTIHWMI